MECIKKLHETVEILETLSPFVSISYTRQTVSTVSHKNSMFISSDVIRHRTLIERTTSKPQVNTEATTRALREHYESTTRALREYPRQYTREHRNVNLTRP